MKRRDFLFSAGTGLAAFALSGCRRDNRERTDKPPFRKPNFFIIFTDDQGYADVGCYGARGFSTPNLNGMAEDGLRFTDFYVAATVCTPSRAALLTGCYPKRVGLHEAVLYPYSNTGLNPEEITIPEMLKTTGYVSACIGKWHLGHHPEFMPLRQGFDEFFGVPYSNDMDRHYYRFNDFQSPPLPLYRNEDLIESGPDQDYLTKRYTEEAVRFIRDNREKPFFLYLAHSMPHLPLHVSEQFAGKSERGLYGDVIQELDWSVGQILAVLEEEGLAENTLVVFTSDNGPVIRQDAGSAEPLRGGKATTWEGGQRVPCIMRWPQGISPGKACRELVTAMDFLPTFAALAQTGLPENIQIDGQNIDGLLKSPEDKKSPNEAFFYYARDGKVEAVREGKWKLHTAKSRGWNPEEGPFPVSLFDLESDIGETNNVAAQHPEVVERLKGKMTEFDAELSRYARPVGKFNKR
jgi:arylsulfatase A